MKKIVILAAALMAFIPLSSGAQCLLVINGVEVPGDPELIEGTKDADIIDCRSSPHRHDIYGYGGNDTIYGSDFDDFIAGGGGTDIIYGGGGNDAIDGGADDDTIDGQAGNDVLFGGVGASPASGVGCELQLAATGSSYLKKGGSGNDTIYGGDGDDCIDAGSGEDLVFGEDGNDTIEGGNHGDVLNGGPGDDHIDGGWHTDTCIGGGGNDTFISCELDSAPFCGDESCDSNEICSCELDCGPPADWELSCVDGEDDDCDGSVDCDDADCSATPSCPCNNDGTCDPGEDCNNCSNDCAGRSKGKPATRYCCGDGTAQSAEGDGSICDENP
jgi:hypothetical protein